MSVELNPTNKIIARLKLQPNGEAQQFFTNECAKHMDPFVPFDTGTLAETVIINGQPTTNVKEDKITYAQEYAKVVYYGVREGKELTIHQDMHPLATTYWDKHMWTSKGKEIIKSVEDYIKRGGKQ